MNYKPLLEIEEGIAKKIVDAAFTTHKKLGPGLLVPKGIASPKKLYSPRWIAVFYEMYFFNGVITIFEKMFKVIYNCIQWGKICFCHELSKRGLKYQRQVDVPIVYDGIVFNEGLRLDVLVEELVICELLRGVPSGKAVDGIHPVKYFDHLCQQNPLLALFHRVNPVWEAQILSHLKLTDKRLGFLTRLPYFASVGQVNFNVSLPEISGISKGLFYNFCVFVPWWQYE